MTSRRQRQIHLGVTALTRGPTSHLQLGDTLPASSAASPSQEFQAGYYKVATPLGWALNDASVNGPAWRGRELASSPVGNSPTALGGEVVQSRPPVVKYHCLKKQCRWLCLKAENRLNICLFGYDPMLVLSGLSVNEHGMADPIVEGMTHQGSQLKLGISAGVMHSIMMGQNFRHGGAPLRGSLTSHRALGLLRTNRMRHRANGVEMSGIGEDSPQDRLAYPCSGP
ncbi:hypothetical protein G7046_g4309 [Stylonectria norvegica]|nr:hypothetical protein G7046_g4309 [Stylonectria norvegica]